VSVTLLEPGLIALLDSPAGPVARNITAKAEAVAELARQNVQAQFRTRTGNLQQSIGVFPRETPDGLEAEVGTEGAPYGLVLELGSDPHLILPVAAPVLVSPPGHPDPLDAPRVRVDHPGSIGRPWLRPALEQVINGA
jgi:hypothetical protein